MRMKGRGPTGRKEASTTTKEPVELRRRFLFLHGNPKTPAYNRHGMQVAPKLILPTPKLVV